MHQNSPENRRPKLEKSNLAQEKLEISVEIATEKDLEAIKKLRLFAIQSKEDSYLLAANPEEERSKNDDQWSKETFGEDKFVVLAWRGDDAVGMARGEKEDDAWYCGSAYVKPQFRNSDIGLKIFSAGLREILANKGTKVTFSVRKKNEKMLKFANLLGAKIVKENPSRVGYAMELDLTDPDVLKKLNRVLHAG